MTTPARTAAMAVAALLLTAGCGSAPSADPAASGRGPAPVPHRTAEAPAAKPLATGRNAWVAVSVATLWRSPSAPRPVDAPALANPAGIRTWLDTMTTAERRALNGRADTQALLGDRVVVLRLRPGWARVAVPDQPTPDDPRGYLGWVPRRQLTGTAPPRTETRATVVVARAWLRSDDAAAEPRLQVSFGTRLPVLGSAGRFVRVRTPSGEVARLRAAQVSVHARGEPALTPTRAGLVATATTFTGLEYLWAGRSGFGFDCSGLTSLVYRAHGLTIPRDAAPQAQAGRGVAAGSLARGDLMFYATDGKVHHVSMYAGHGQMVHSPRTGSTVEVVATSTPAYAQEYAGARRFLG